MRCFGHDTNGLVVAFRLTKGSKTKINTKKVGTGCVRDAPQREFDFVSVLEVLEVRVSPLEGARVRGDHYKGSNRGFNQGSLPSEQMS